MTSHSVRILRVVLSMLTGLVLLATSALPAMILLHERAPWREVVEMVAAMHRFFGNWISVGLPLGLMAAVPLMGACLLVNSLLQMRHPRHPPPHRVGGEAGGRAAGAEP